MDRLWSVMSGKTRQPQNPQGRDFSPAFVVAGMLTMQSLCSFLQLHPKDGCRTALIA
jgi:hypothetical protein